MTHRADVDVSILINTFEKPRHLALSLESIALQQAGGVGLEVVVSDDGSDDDTARVVTEAAGRLPYPVRFTAQPHDGFRLARVRNNAARLATGRYLLFLDGDCILPRGHVAAFLARRRPGAAQLCYCARLPESTSARLAPGTLDGIDLDALAPAAELRLLRRRWRKAWWHDVLRHPTKPRLAGGNFGVWKTDFERINGFDERFVGWGQEDDDLGLRLRATGVRLESILDLTRSLHVWHPVDPTATRRWRDGANVGYFERRGRLAACRLGLVERVTEDLTWGLPADSRETTLGRAVLREIAGGRTMPTAGPCEIELVTRPGRGRFHRPAECRLVLAEPEARVEPSLERQADRVARVAPDDAAFLRAVLGQIG